MVPPAASAANTWITSTLIESTNDTAEIAADPTLLTIIVSAVPIREFRICSTTTGTSNAHSCLLVNKCFLCPSSVSMFFPHSFHCSFFQSVLFYLSLIYYATPEFLSFPVFFPGRKYPEDFSFHKEMFPDLLPLSSVGPRYYFPEKTSADSSRFPLI